MLRSEKEIKEIAAIESIIGDASVCRLGLSKDAQPYVVPLNFGYEKNTFYFHGAGEGKKIDIIRSNPNVCFELDIRAKVVEAPDPCFWGMNYQSVIGFGIAVILEDIEEKRKGFNIIMAHYSDQSFAFDDKFLNATAVIKVEIESMTGKQSGDVLS
jgi:nitroimidazol reductase NimA-like FMN-containing flavoprotein (pyridoxamine 5'-phosphate oxidase superfamily)